jgi:serine/threonine protein kinase
MENDFYRQLLKSGLVAEDVLRRVVRTLEVKNKDRSAAAFYYSSALDYAANAPVTVQRLQHLPKLRYPRSGQPPAVSGQNDTGNCSDPLADALEALGCLNRWQIGQLMEGRTKFSLDEYQICDSLGQGGYGHLFLAHDPSAFQFVAVKVLPLSKETPELTRRFQNEIALQRELLHPNLVRFLAAGEDGNVSYMVHEFVDGGDLRQLMKQEIPLPVDVVCPVVAQTARALTYLHSNGIVHRDIKPGNILLSSTGAVKVIDLGLALRSSLKEAGQENSSSSRVAGTVDYMAPEQLRNPNEPLPSWDIYSLGITMYQMLTGAVPFPDGDSQEKFRVKLDREPRDARIYNQAIPYDVADLLRSMITNQAGRRTLTTEEIVSRLDVWSPAGGLESRLVF